MKPTRKTLFLVSGSLLFLIGAAVAWGMRSLPDTSILKTHYPLVTWNEKTKTNTIKLQKQKPVGWVSLYDVSALAVHAVVISEDWAFYQHRGLDFQQIKKAFKKNWRLKKYARGASTITQQVARNVFLSKQKTIRRKLAEVFVASDLERKLSKNRILEIYLNIAEWGPGFHGIRKASQHYFGKSPALLTAKEGAFLAMLLPSPRKYSSSFRERKLSPYAQETIESILQKMVQAKYLTESEAAIARRTPLSFEAPEPVPFFEIDTLSDER